MAKDPREYGYEGDMVISQLKSIVTNAERLMTMLKPETDLPEWVQLKVTLAQDYISTASDYMESEMKEAVSPAQQAAIAISMKKAGKKPKDQKDEACWSGYTAKGMKMKGGRMVPNCVPAEETKVNEMDKSGRPPGKEISHRSYLATKKDDEEKTKQDIAKMTPKQRERADLIRKKFRMEAVTTEKPPFEGPYKKADKKPVTRSHLKSLTKAARDTISKSSQKKSK